MAFQSTQNLQDMIERVSKLSDIDLGSPKSLYCVQNLVSVRANIGCRDTDVSTEVDTGDNWRLIMLLLCLSNSLPTLVILS